MVYTEYTIAGSYTYSIPFGAKLIEVILTGPGGGGASGQKTSANGVGGGGGASRRYCY